MVSQQSVQAQLKRIGFNQRAWGRQEVRELPNIILPDEEIFECVNGIYEGGFALLVATDVRVLLIDKKPFNFLTIEDLRFDMINEIDYNHRVLGAYVDITTGNRELKFRSYNQPRLRKLIGHVQRCMADIKKSQVSNQEGQHQHLEQINSHLKTYLLEQYKHQEELQQRLEKAQKGEINVASPATPPRPSPELSDYLLAHGLLDKYEAQTGQKVPRTQVVEPAEDNSVSPESQQRELYAEGRREVFGKRPATTGQSPADGGQPPGATPGHPFDINPLRIAYSKLPMALRNRKFGRPSLHAHSQARETVGEPQLG